MKKIPAICLVLLGALALGAPYVQAEEEPDAGKQIGSKWDPPPEEVTKSGKGGLRHHRLMRDLNEAYQRGSLTKTEYIQRKRLIEAEEK